MSHALPLVACFAVLVQEDALVRRIVDDPKAPWHQPQTFAPQAFPSLGSEYVTKLRVRMLWRVEKEARTAYQRVQRQHAAMTRADMFRPQHNRDRAAAALRVELKRALNFNALLTEERQRLEEEQATVEFRQQYAAQLQAVLSAAQHSNAARNACANRKRGRSRDGGWNKRRSRDATPQAATSTAKEEAAMFPDAGQHNAASNLRSMNQFINMSSRINQVPFVRHPSMSAATTTSGGRFRRDTSGFGAPALSSPGRRSSSRGSRRWSRARASILIAGSSRRSMESMMTSPRARDQPPPPPGVSMSEWARILSIRSSALQAATEYRTDQMHRRAELRQQLQGSGESAACGSAEHALQGLDPSTVNHGDHRAGGAESSMRQARSKRPRRRRNKRHEHRHRRHRVASKQGHAASVASTTDQDLRRASMVGTVGTKSPPPGRRKSSVTFAFGVDSAGDRFGVARMNTSVRSTGSEDSQTSGEEASDSSSGLSSDYSQYSGSDGSSREAEALANAEAEANALQKESVVPDALLSFDEMSGKQAVRSDLFIRQSLSLIFDLALHAMDTAEAAVEAIEANALDNRSYRGSGGYDDDASSCSSGSELRSSPSRGGHRKHKRRRATPGTAPSRVVSAALEHMHARSSTSANVVASGLSGMSAAANMLAIPQSHPPADTTTPSPSEDHAPEEEEEGEEGGEEESRAADADADDLQRGGKRSESEAEATRKHPAAKASSWLAVHADDDETQTAADATASSDSSLVGTVSRAGGGKETTMVLSARKSRRVMTELRVNNPLLAPLGLVSLKDVKGESGVGKLDVVWNKVNADIATAHTPILSAAEKDTYVGADGGVWGCLTCA